jgi:hypothetical protein
VGVGVGVEQQFALGMGTVLTVHTEHCTPYKVCTQTLHRDGGALYTACAQGSLGTETPCTQQNAHDIYTMHTEHIGTIVPEGLGSFWSGN